MGDEARERCASADHADVGPIPPLAKKRRRGGGEELRRVAEIVMVLSAMAEIRAGKEPTAAEKALVAEARERLARACEEVRPKDLFSSEAVRVVVEDLGLNRSRDPSLAFRTSKMSIAERLQHTKKKMKESRDHVISAHASLPPSTSGGPSSESHGSQRLVAGKSSPMLMTAGGFPTNSTAVHIPALASSLSSVKQSPTNEAQTVLVKSSLGKDSSSVAMPSVEVVNQRPDARINGPAYFTLVRPTAVTNCLMEKTSASAISTSTALTAQSQTSTSQGNHDVKVIQGSHQMMKTHDTKNPAVQATQVNIAIGNQASQGLTFVSVPSFISSHNEIAKSVMGVLQSMARDNPNTPILSNEYITKPLNCQICKVIITDVESLIVCDACERGTHLKCLQFHVTNIVPKTDWQCSKCLSASNGKPFAPRYGRITKGILAVKATSSGGGTILVEKNAEIPEAKFSYNMPVENENSSSFGVVQVPNFGGGHEESTRESKAMNGKESEESISNCNGPGEGMHSGASINHLEKFGLASVTHKAQIETSNGQTTRFELPVMEATGSACDSQFRSFDQRPEQSCFSTSATQRSFSEIMPDIKAQSEYFCSNQRHGTAVEIACNSQLTSDLQVIKEVNVPNWAESTGNLMQNTSTTITDDLKDFSKPSEMITNHVEEVNLEAEHSQWMHDQVFRNDSGSVHCGKSSKENLHELDWVGDIIEVVENRTYYKSCRIDGCIIKLHDNVIVSTNNNNFYPAKLLSLWEDNKVLSKLAIVNEYCFPGNLPEGVSQPSTPYKDEVYALDRRSTILASSICGLCDVLPKDKFREEAVRSALSTDKAHAPHLVFMCKWMFDESKGIFQSLDHLS